MPDMPQEVQDAYEHAKRKQRPHSAPLPRWEELSVELREAFILQITRLPKGTEFIVSVSEPQHP